MLFLKSLFNISISFVVKRITATMSNGDYSYEGEKVPADSNVLKKRIGDRAKLTDGGTRHECLGNSLSYTRNVTVSTDKYFEFVFSHQMHKVSTM
jgi:hypothetical protein